MIAWDREEPTALDELYHCNSKHSPTQIAFVNARTKRQRERILHDLYEEAREKYKTYTAAACVVLPPPGAELEMSVGRAIRTRRSQRTFSQAAVSLTALGELLRYGYGSHERDDGTLSRAVPSGGGLYPLDVYVLQRPGGQLAEGVYHYHVGRHVLQYVRRRCTESDLRGASIYPDLVASAALVMAVVADLPRVRIKYGERAYRLALLEAGYVGQSVYLVANALRLGAVALDGFYDDKVHALLGLDGVAQISLMMIAIGYPDA